MKKQLLALFLSLLLLAGCSGGGAEKDRSFRVLATTYPVYLLASAVTEGAEGVRVDLLVKERVSCLHDYTLTVTDMKAIEGADLLILNGAGLEEFLKNALAQSSAPVIDCSAGVELLSSLEEEEGEFDPHIWMDPDRAAVMAGNIGEGLSQADPAQAGTYRENAGAVSAALTELKRTLQARTGGLSLHRELITFHDGFRYFSEAFGFSLLKSFEEEEGAETSASELKEITALIAEYGIPAIFTERNGSESAAKALERETGCAVRSLDMMMSGEGRGLVSYLDAMTENIDTVCSALGGEEEAP